MSDSDFVDVGDELVVRISGYPVGKAEVSKINQHGVTVRYMGVSYLLPLDFKSHDTVDGVAHTDTGPPVNPLPECNCPSGPHVCGMPEYIAKQHGLQTYSQAAPVVNDFGEDADGYYPQQIKGRDDV